MTLSRSTRPTAMPTRSKPLTMSLSCAVSPPEMEILRQLGALAQAGADGVEHGGVGLLDRDVVDQRQRLGADADHVVDVHGDAIDADRVVLAHHVGDDRLRADAVGAQRKADAVQLDDVGEVADRQHDAAACRAAARFRARAGRCCAAPGPLRRCRRRSPCKPLCARPQASVPPAPKLRMLARPRPCSPLLLQRRSPGWGLNQTDEPVNGVVRLVPAPTRARSTRSRPLARPRTARAGRLRPCGHRRSRPLPGASRSTP